MPPAKGPTISEWPTTRNDQGERIQSFYKAWASGCERAGLQGLLFQDLRRSAVRNMERAGIPRKVAMAISGHKTESIYRRYGIISARDLAAAARMEQYLEAAKNGGTGTLLGTPHGEEEGSCSGDVPNLLN